MKNVPFELPHGIEPTTLVQTIDDAIRSVGLMTTMRNTLRKYPGCVHWNLANGSQPGAIELTYWPKEDRAWFTFADGPRPGWTGAKIEELGDVIRERIGRQFGR